MKKLAFLLVIVAQSLLSSASISVPDTTGFGCGFDELKGQKMQDTNYAAFQKSLDKFILWHRELNPDLPFFPKQIQEFETMSSSCDTCLNSKTLYLVPLVVHVFHLPAHSTVGIGSNISYAQIQNAIYELNKAFAAWEILDPNAAHTGIQFYLAPVGPQGKGVLRYSSGLSNHIPFKYDALWNLVDNQYNKNKYINIFVTNEFLNSDSNDVVSLAGYASLPENNNVALVVKRKWFGNYECFSGDTILNNRSRGKTLPHEIGHYLGLYHTFEQACAEDSIGTCSTSGDRCCDTPPQIEKNTNCIDPSFNACNTSRPTLPGNCMDYTYDNAPCGFWFTRDQAKRMHATLNIFYKNLINIDSVNAIGIKHCGISANFVGRQNIICDPDTVHLTALDLGSTVQYRWQIKNANTVLLDTTGMGLFKIKYNLPDKDTFDVILTVIRGLDTVSLQKDNYIMHRNCEPIEDKRAHWYFGEYAGLLFTKSGDVVPEMGSLNYRTLNTNEGTLSLSNSTGELLFYGGPVNDNNGLLYQKNSNGEHVKIKKQDGSDAFIKCRNSTAQPLLPIPHPSKTGRYMVFSNFAFAGAMHIKSNRAKYRGGLYFTELFKDQNNLWVADSSFLNKPVKGLEGVPIVRDNQDSAILTREYLTAISKCDNNGYWLITMADWDPDTIAADYNNGKLLVLSVDTDGISLHDTLSLPENYARAFFGQMKFSRDGNFFALKNYLFEFDRLSGKAKVKAKFSEKDVYQHAFSNNSQILYFIEQEAEKNVIYQYPLVFSSLQEQPVVATLVGESPSYRNGIQLGPDNKIYISNYDEYLDQYHPFLSVINQPDNVIGSTGNQIVDFRENGQSLQMSGVGGKAIQGLPTFIESVPHNQQNGYISFERKDCDTFIFSPRAICAVNYKWYFGNGDSSTLKNPRYAFSPGNYTISLVADGQSYSTVLTVKKFSISISGRDTLCTLESGSNYSIVHINDTLGVKNKYHWKISNGNLQDTAKASTTINFSGNETQLIAKVTNPLTGCIAHDTLQVVKYTNIANNIINQGEDLKIYCRAIDTVHIEGSQPTGSNKPYQYVWHYWGPQFPKQTDTFQNLKTSMVNHDTIYTYREVFSNQCVSVSDTIMVEIRENKINNGADTLIQYAYTGNNLQIVGSISTGHSNVSYQWYYSKDSIIWQPVQDQSNKNLESDTFTGYRWFYRKVASNYCDSSSNIVKVYPQMWNYNIGDSSLTLYCNAGNNIITESFVTGGIGQHTYKWFESTNGVSWALVQSGYNHGYSFIANGQPQYFKRRVISGTDSIESNVIQYKPLVYNNQIQKTFANTHFVCNQSINNYTNTATTPIIHMGASPTYTWYKSYDSTTFTPIAGAANKDLQIAKEDTFYYVYRVVEAHGCQNQSETIKVMPILNNNEVWTSNEFCITNEPSGIYPSTQVRGNAVVNNAAQYTDYTFKWQVNTPSNNFWIDHLPFQTPGDESLYNFKYASYYFDSIYTTSIRNINIRRIVSALGCIDTSSSIYLHNYYHPGENSIVQNQDLLYGTQILELNNNWEAKWQYECNNEWENISNSVNKDSLFEIEQYFPRNLRRIIYSKDINGNIANCKASISNEYQTDEIFLESIQAQLGETIVFDAFPDKEEVQGTFQWQECEANETEFVNIPDQTNKTLEIYTDKCTDLRKYRVIYYHDCKTIVSNEATISLNQENLEFFTWLKDIPSDTAAEPHDNILDRFFLSPDIIVGLDSFTMPSNQWPHQYSENVNYYNGVYLQTIIRNKGADTSREGKLFLYASLAGLNPQWEVDFTDTPTTTKLLNNITNDTIYRLNWMLNNQPPYNAQTYGAKINQEGIKLPPIPPNDSVIISYHWYNPPEHLTVQTITVQNVNHTFTDKRTILYLARIEECNREPYGMTIAEHYYKDFPNSIQRKSAKHNIKNNAKIAAIHSHKLPTKGPRIYSTNLEKLPDQWTVVPYHQDALKLQLQTGLSNNFFNVAELYVYFDDNLWDAFVSGGSSGGGFVIVENGVFKVDPNSSTYWDNISIPLDSVGNVGFSMHYKEGTPITNIIQLNTFSVDLLTPSDTLGQVFLQTETDGHLGMGRVEATDTFTNKETQTLNQSEKAKALQKEKQVQEGRTRIHATNLVFDAIPNPTNAMLQVLVANQGSNAYLTIRNAQGKELEKFPLSNKQEHQSIKVNLGNYADGLYFIQLQTEDTNKTIKVILNKD